MNRSACLFFSLLTHLPVFGFGADLVSVPFLKNDSPFNKSGPLFQKLNPADTGIDFVNPIDTDHPDD